MLVSLSSDENVHLISNANNLGVATALNQGINYAMDCGFNWVITLDDDSLLYDDTVAKMIDVFMVYPHKEKIGILYPNPIMNSFSSANTNFIKECNNRLWCEVDFVNSSGSLINLDVHQKLGPFIDDFFTDCFDLEYGLRQKVNGFKTIVACKAKMHQQLGNIKTVKMFNREFSPTNHSYLRRYYSARNTILILRTYIFKEPLIVLNNFLKSVIKIALKIIMFESDKKRKISSMLLGMWHGIKGRSKLYWPDGYTSGSIRSYREKKS